jgi:hypothetical protein
VVLAECLAGFVLILIDQDDARIDLLPDHAEPLGKSARQ